MPKSCCFGCPAIGVTMHGYPNHKKIPERFKVWVFLVGGKLETPSDYENYSKKRVCDIHFTDKDRNRNSRLNALAIPSLHLPANILCLDDFDQGLRSILNHDTNISNCAPSTLRKSVDTEITCDTAKAGNGIVKEHSYSAISGPMKKPTRNAVNLAPVAKMNPQVAKNAANRIVWVDLEMTGLNIDEDHILEIACLITDAELNVVASGPTLVIHQPDNILNNMNEWCIAQHRESGLTEASRRSTVSLIDAENRVLKFVKTHAPEKKCPMGGNSIYMDRLFIRKYMPKLNDYLHYRVIDVSSIKELAKRWYQKEYSALPAKQFKHRAINDIHESIAELKYYQENIFKIKE